MRRSTAPLALLCVLTALLGACQASQSSAPLAATPTPSVSPSATEYQPPFLTPQDARARAGLVIGDVRPAESYKVEHVEGAENLPFSAIATWQAQKDKTKPLAVYCTCEDDGLAIKTARTLHEQYGFSQVFVLEGGLAGWKNAGLPTSK